MMGKKIPKDLTSIINAIDIEANIIFLVFGLTIYLLVVFMEIMKKDINIKIDFSLNLKIFYF